MSANEIRNNAKGLAIHRKERLIDLPVDTQGRPLRVSEYYGENVFDFTKSSLIPENIKKELIEVSGSGKKLKKENAEVVARAVTDWAISKGATHFCHWFQPLTGGTAEKHDAFLTLGKDGAPLERLSATQLMQGEPDASSFPNGGSRSTFEARGYTSWDLTSPMFLMEGANGKTLCIPTAFVSYYGDALDIKTPLLRSVSKIDEAATRFLNLTGRTDSKKVKVNTGAEQEYFLVDKAFYFSRPDLVMTGRTLFGALSSKNQQLDDHYFGTISERALSFMQELDFELHKLGIPAKTRHNEVAPGQFEIAPIFNDVNVASDHNQLMMAILKSTAKKHDFVALLHEKPFAGINGSGKHLNWSMSDNTGLNLLDPGNRPESNMRFLATVAMIIEAVHRNAGMLRMAIASAGNDHRLGANEAPPSIISVFLGDTLEKIYESILAGKTFKPTDDTLDMGAQQLANLLMDNTDRNRTSPFAFTGNRFEFRAVGSASAIGLPLSILNAAVAQVMEESNEILEKEIKDGKAIDDALLDLTRKWVGNSKNVIFNGDGYSQEWVEEAASRGLPNHHTTADALKVLSDKKQTAFLVESGVFTKNELETRHNVLIERYIAKREIEFNTLVNMVNQHVIPTTIEYKRRLSKAIKSQQDINLESAVELELYKKISFSLDKLFANNNNLRSAVENLPEDETKRADAIASELFPLSESVAEGCSELEDLVPDELWCLPKYFDMLFIR
jgi:glutamine synthetase